MKSKILKIIVIMIACITILWRIGIYNRKSTIIQKPVILVSGFDENQTGIINELEYVNKEYNYIRVGNKLLKEGRFDEAIEEFNVVLKRNRETASLIDAKVGLINVYEKKHNYKESLKRLEALVEKYKVPVTNIFRIPDEERLKYLKYAYEGNYDLAVLHAQKAAEASSKLPNRKGKPREDYVERLNDIRSAKVYIESLKKE